MEDLARHGAFLRRVARAMLDEHRADDAVQDSYVAALEAAGPPPRRWRAWLATVVRNIARMRLREDRRRLSREHRSARPEGGPGPAEQLERLELHERLLRAVRELDAPYREAVMLRFLDGIPPRDIARRLRVPVATVRTRLQRGLAILRARLDDKDRRAWALALAPLLVRDAPPVAVTAAVGGTLAMKKLGLCFAALALLLTGWISGRALWRRPPDIPRRERAAAAVPVPEPTPATVSRPESTAVAPPEHSDAAPPATTPEVVVTGPSWSGFILRANGAPWDGELRLQAMGRPRSSWTGRTDSTGFIRIDTLAPGRKRLDVVFPRGWCTLGEISVPKGGEVRQDFRLPGSAGVRARILLDGKPPQQALFVLFPESAPPRTVFQTADEEGYVALDDLAAEPHVMELRGPVLTRLGTVRLRDGEILDLGDLEIGPTARAEVQFVVPRGTVMPRSIRFAATVATPAGEPAERTEFVTPDRDGLGVLKTFPPGTHTFRLSTIGYRGQEVTLAVPSTTPARIVLEQPERR